MKTKFVRLILGTAIALASPLAPLRAQFAYVANLNSNNVSAYSIGSGGVLTPVPGSPFPVGPNPASVAVDPTGKFAYVINDSNVPEVPGTVSAFTIGSNGALTPVLEVQIVSIGNNIYTLKAEGKGVDLDCLANPVTVGLTIGISIQAAPP
jgi:DNA-binding beta-propeller fold protein YncE